VDRLRVVSSRSSAAGDPRRVRHLHRGAGPAGISASLRAIEKKLSYVTLRAGRIRGTVAKYPRQKLVLTSPVEFPMHGKFNKLQISKEEILRFWRRSTSKRV